MTMASMAQGKQILDLLSGATKVQVQNLISNGGLLQMMAEADLSKVDRDLFQGLLFHGLCEDIGIFSSPEKQLDDVRREYGLAFTTAEYSRAQEQITGLSRPAGSLHAWVLYGTLITLKKTFDFLVVQRMEFTSRHPALQSDPELMRLLPGIEFVPNTLSWVLIDFGAHLYKSPSLVRSNNSAGLELLASAWLHPKWARSMGQFVKDTFVPNVNMLGVEARLSTADDWAWHLDMRRGGFGVSLSFGKINDACRTWGSPTILAKE